MALPVAALRYPQGYNIWDFLQAMMGSAGSVGSVFGVRACIT